MKQGLDEAMRICQYAIVAATLLVAFMVVSWFAHFGDPQYKWYFWMGQWLLLGLAVISVMSLVNIGPELKLLLKMSLCRASLPDHAYNDH